MRAKYSLSVAQILMALSGPPRRLFRNALRSDRPKAKLIRIERITPGGHHAWCESNVGLVRKPLASVPDDLIREFSATSIGGAI